MFRGEMDENKWNIFVCAVDLFSEGNYLTVPVKAIARKAGFQPATFYNYFKSKDELLQLVYRYYIEFMASIAPDWDTLNKRLETEHPVRLLRETLCVVYPPNMAEVLHKVTKIIVSQISNDTRAEEAMQKTLALSPRKMRLFLMKMIELNKVEPFDIDSFILLYTGFSYYGAARFTSVSEISIEQRDQALAYLCGTVRVIHAQPPADGGVEP